MCEYEYGLHAWTVSAMAAARLTSRLWKRGKVVYAIP